MGPLLARTAPPVSTLYTLGFYCGVLAHSEFLSFFTCKRRRSRYNGRYMKIPMLPPTAVVWRVAMTFVSALAALTALGTSLCSAGEPNKLDATENAAGFQLLFDGKNLDAAWKNGGNWKVEDGSLAREGKGGSLVYAGAKVPDDFELRFEWKVAEGSNSGIYYRPGQYEYQVLDNNKHNDGSNPRTSAASLYFCIAPSKDNTRPVGEWNEARIVCKGSVIQHWLNGEKVIDFDYADPKNAEHVQRLKARGGDVEARGGNLSFQDHGDPVWYRSIRLRTIPAEEKIELSEVVPAEIPEQALVKEASILQRIKENRDAQREAAGAKK